MYGFTTESIKYLFLIPFIIIISIIDYNTKYIYDITILSGIIIQAIIFIATINTDLNANSHLIGFITGISISYMIAKITKGLGSGDIGVYGLCCFVLGHNYSIYMISLSFLLASIYCLYIIFIKKNKQREIPFAPFISLATILIIFTNYDILNIYFDIISN